MDRISDNGWFNHFLYPITDLDKWCRKWELAVFIGICSKCKKELEVNIPFVNGTKRGLTAPKCSCGNEMVPFSFVDKYNFFSF